MWILHYALNENYNKSCSHGFLGACKFFTYKFINTQMFFNLEVLTLNFAHSFQVFMDTEPLAKSDIEEIQKEWAKYFLKVRITS